MRNESSDVLNEFQQGSVDAFETLFRLHQRAVYGWILRIVRNPATAEDLTVESFWRIHQAHARFEPAHGIRRLGAAHRHPCGARLAANHAAENRTGRRDLWRIGGSGGRPTRPVSAEIRRKTAQAFERLPPKLRIAAILAVVEEQPHKDVAAALGISVAAVKLRVFRALRLLRKDLATQGITP